MTWSNCPDCGVDVCTTCMNDDGLCPECARACDYCGLVIGDEGRTCKCCDHYVCPEHLDIDGMCGACRDYPPPISPPKELWAHFDLRGEYCAQVGFLLGAVEATITTLRITSDVPGAIYKLERALAVVEADAAARKANKRSQELTDTCKSILMGK